MPPGSLPAQKTEVAAHEIELAHATAHAIMKQRHPGIPDLLLRDQIIYDDDLRAEYREILAKLHQHEDAR